MITCDTHELKYCERDGERVRDLCHPWISVNFCARQHIIYYAVARLSLKFICTL